jgi:hypothetical protein
MSKHGAISPEEAAAIRELVEAYAYCADRRDAEGQMSLLTADTHFVVYMNAKGPTPSREFHSRARDTDRVHFQKPNVSKVSIFSLKGPSQVKPQGSWRAKS